MEKTRAKAFRRLFFDIKSAWLDGPSSESVKFVGGSRDDFNEWSVKPIAWGWTARAIRSGEAAVRLADAGLSEETSPLLRSAIEHAMFLWWLQADRGKVIEVFKRTQKNSLSRLIAAQPVGWAIEPPTLEVIREMMDDATEQHKDLDVFAKVGHLAGRYTDDLGNLFQAWLYDTQTAHATLQSANSYYQTIRIGESSELEVRLLKVPETIDAAAAKAAVAALVALTAYSKACGLEAYYGPRLDRFDAKFAALMTTGPAELPAP